jgi:antirestriction protein ArdC
MACSHVGERRMLFSNVSMQPSNLTNRFGNRAYAAELVAELASAFLCAEFGINKEVRHASYIANWIELLRADDRAFFTAALQAQKAADYLRGLALTESLVETVA